jgi:hypothetical protein
MLRVENFPEGIGAVVDHRSPVGFDLRYRLLAQAALQQGDNVMMAQVGVFMAMAGGCCCRRRISACRCPAVPTSASTSQICDAHETWRAAPLINTCRSLSHRWRRAASFSCASVAV